MRTSDKPQVLLNEPGIVVAGWRDVFIEDWRGPVKASAVRGKFERQLEFHQRAGGKAALLSVIRDGAMSAPDAETRAIINEMNPRIDPTTTAGVIAMLASGFAASVVRGVVTGLMLARRTRFPVKVLDSVAAAAEWLAPHMASRPEGAVVTSEIVAAYAIVAAVPTR